MSVHKHIHSYTLRDKPEIHIYIIKFISLNPSWIIYRKKEEENGVFKNRIEEEEEGGKREGERKV